MELKTQHVLCAWLSAVATARSRVTGCDIGLEIPLRQWAVRILCLNWTDITFGLAPDQLGELLVVGRSPTVLAIL